MFTKGTLVALLMGGLFFASCKKEGKVTSAEVEATVESTENDSEADVAYDDVFNTTMGIGTENGGEEIGWTGGIGVYGRMEGNSYTGRTDSTGNRCFTVTITPKDRGVFPKTVVINFGNGCLGRDGKLRKGKIITVYSGPMRIPGSKATTTFEGHKIDSVLVEGTHEVVNSSTSNKQALTTKVIGGKLTWDSGRWVRWSTVRTITQVEGNGTPFFPLDDIFTIIGAGRGENSRGKSWAHEITQPLVKKFTCRWISKGVMQIRHNAVVGTLDFGDGSCDNKATVTINGTTKEIRLR